MNEEIAPLTLAAAIHDIEANNHNSVNFLIEEIERLPLGHQPQLLAQLCRRILEEIPNERY